MGKGGKGKVLVGWGEWMGGKVYGGIEGVRGIVEGDLKGEVWEMVWMEVWEKGKGWFVEEEVGKGWK